MSTDPRSRPSVIKSGVAFGAGAMIGLGLLAPGWTGPVVSIAPDQFGVAVGLAVLALLAFTVCLWLVVVVFILR